MTTLLTLWMEAHYKMKNWEDIYWGTLIIDVLSLIPLYALVV